MNTDNKQYGGLDLQVGSTVKHFQTPCLWSIIVKIPPVLSAISSTFDTLNVVNGPKQQKKKKPQIILVCFLGAMVTTTERNRFVFAQRCSNQGGNAQTNLAKLESERNINFTPITVNPTSCLQQKQ